MDTEAENWIDGNIDSLDKGVISGWAWNPLEPNKPVELELLADGNVAACFSADILREDLKVSGKGDGYCAFSISLPPELLDGVERELRIQTRGDGQVLPNGTFGWGADTRYKGHLEAIEGSSIVGWAMDTDSTESIEIQLFGGDSLIANDTADKPRGDVGGEYGFRIPLPTEFLDGRPYSFILREAGSGSLIAASAFITPRISTSWEALRKNSDKSLRAQLSPLASFRYESLSRQMEIIQRNAGQAVRDAKPEVLNRIAGDLRTLRVVHDALVKGFDKPGPFNSLSFEPVEDPDVSVVIPLHNQFNVTYNCLASLLLAPNRARFEVIVVDDGSDDATVGIEEIVQGIKVVRNEKSLGFVHACNKGASQARGRYLVMLNNDTEVTTGWLDELIWPFEHFDKVGLTGSMLLYPDGRLQEAGGIVWRSGDPLNYGRGQNPHVPHFNYTRLVDYVSGASIMITKALWEELKGFDAQYAPAYFEDTDLAFRVREKDFKTVYAPFSKVIHYEGMSNGTKISTGIKRYQEINRPKFKSRWVTACRDHGDPGDGVERIKDRNVDYRALVIDVEVPRQDMDAGSYAAIQEMRLLQSLGFKLTFLPEDLMYRGPYTEELQRMGVECVYEPYALSVGDLLSKRGGEFDVVYITRYYIADKVIDLVRKFAPQAKVVFNNADLHFLRELRMALANKSEEQVRSAKETRELELAVMRKVDLVLSYSDVEHAIILSHNLDQTNVAKCPWVVEPVESVPPFEARQDIAFLGSYRHPPNPEAVEYFVQDVMPLLRNRLPGVRFLVYGSYTEEFFQDLPVTEDVVIKGWVDDVDAVYSCCRVFVSPLLSGAGIKGKLIAAFAHGVPSVVSPIAVEGLGAMSARVATIANSAEEWVEGIAALYEDQETWEVASSAARDYATSMYSFDRGRELMISALREVGVFPTEEPLSLAARL